MQYCVHILDSRNSFLRSFTPGPSAIYLSVTNSICSELFLHCFLQTIHPPRTESSLSFMKMLRRTPGPVAMSGCFPIPPRTPSSRPTPHGAPAFQAPCFPRAIPHNEMVTVVCLIKHVLFRTQMFDYYLFLSEAH